MSTTRSEPYMLNSYSSNNNNNNNNNSKGIRGRPLTNHPLLVTTFT